MRVPRAVFPSLLLSALSGGLFLSGACSEGSGYGGSLGAEVVKSPGPEDPVEFGALPDFALLDQRGETVSLASLRGKPIVFGAIFTRCYGPCPEITKSMASLQAGLAGTDVQLVSVSVDPEYDRPEVLTAYAETNGADPERWTFLTGGEEEVHDFVRQALHMGVARGEAGDDVGGLVTHATDLLVIDRQGRRRGWYDGLDADAVEACKARLLHLAREAE